MDKRRYKSFINRVYSHTSEEIFNKVKTTLKDSYNFEPTLIEQVLLKEYSMQVVNEKRKLLMLSAKKYFSSNFPFVGEVITRFLYDKYSIDMRLSCTNGEENRDLISKLLKIKQDKFHLI